MSKAVPRVRVSDTELAELPKADFIAACWRPPRPPDSHKRRRGGDQLASPKHFGRAHPTGRRQSQYLLAEPLAWRTNPLGVKNDPAGKIRQHGSVDVLRSPGPPPLLALRT